MGSEGAIAYADSGCNPMNVNFGLVMTEHACKLPSCMETPVHPAPPELDSCITECLKAGYGICKAVHFRPKGSFGLVKNECIMLSKPIEDLGVHATAEVLAAGGLGAAVAGYCKPPKGVAEYPAADSPYQGVDWEAVCNGTQMAIIPDMRMGCASCVFVPDDRKERVTHQDEDKLYYRHAHVSSLLNLVHICRQKRWCILTSIDAEGLAVNFAAVLCACSQTQEQGAQLLA
jgi:hypothetical protein